MSYQFRIARGWRIFVYISTPILTAFFILLAFLPLFEKATNWRLYLLLFLPLSIFMSLLFISALLDTIKAKLVIEHDKIIQHGFFRTKELPFFCIKGYTVDNYIIRIFPTEKGLPKIKVSQYTERLEELEEMLSQRIVNLDKENLRIEEDEIRNNEALGITEKEREDRLRQARKACKVLNNIGFAAGLWLIIYPTPYNIASGLALLFPLVVLFFIYRFRGIIKMHEKPGSAYPSLLTAWMMPAMALALRGLLDFQLLSYTQMWLPVILGTLVVCLLLVICSQPFHAHRKKWMITIFTYLFLAMVYSYGAFMNLNCFADNSHPQYYTVKVLDKHISSGKQTTYYLKLQSWGPVQKEDEVSVSQDVYNKINTGGRVNIYLKKGLLQVPWLVVTD